MWPMKTKLRRTEETAEELAQQLTSVVPPEACLWRKPVCVLKYGLPSANILEVAQQMRADLIVLGRAPSRAGQNQFAPALGDSGPRYR